MMACEPAVEIRRIEASCVRKICSGQVVVDIATAIKELLENALDAGATQVEVHLRDHGVTAIEVVDNGSGIRERDFECVGRRYMTSKLRSFAELEAGVASFGFRGEAVASLCELSGGVEITTRHTSASTGNRLRLRRDGSVLERKSPVPRAVGTTVVVKELFATLPVRRAEVTRNAKKHFTRALRMLQAYALVARSARVRVTNVASARGPKGAAPRPQAILMAAAGRSLAEAASAVFGAKFAGSLEPVQDKAGLLRGLVSRAIGDGVGRAEGDRQFLFVNGRPVDLPKLARAANDVWRQFDMKNKPALIIDFNLRPNEVDVNVAPNKREVIIQSENEVANALKDTLTALWAPKSRDAREFPVVHPHERKSSQTLSTQQTLQDSQDDGCVLTLENDVAARRAMQLASSEQFHCDAEDSPSPRAPFREDNDDSAHASPIRHDNGPAAPETLDSDSFDLANGMEHSGFTAAPIPLQQDGNVVPAAAYSRNDGQNGQALDRDSNVPTKKAITCDKNSRNEEEKYNDVDNTDEDSGGDDAYDDAVDDNVNGNDDDHDDVSRVQYKPVIRQARGHSEAYCMSSTHRSEEDTSAICPTPKRQRPLQGKTSWCVVSPCDRDYFIFHSKEPDDLPLNQHKDTNAEASTAAHAATSASIHQPECGFRESDKAVEDTPSKICDLERKKRKRDDSFTTGKFGTVDPPRRIKIDLDRALGAKGSLGSPRADSSQMKREAATLAGASLDAKDDIARDALSKVVSKQDFRRMRVLGQFNLGFVVAQLDDSLFIIDQHAADEKAKYEANWLLQVTSQPLVAPLACFESAADELVVLDRVDAFEANGFRLKIDLDAPVGSRAKIVALPVAKGVTFGTSDARELITLLTDVPGSTIPRLPKLHTLFASKACRSAVMIGTALDRPQMTRIISQLAELNQPWCVPYQVNFTQLHRNCPHGRPTLRHLTTLRSLGKRSSDC